MKTKIKACASFKGLGVVGRRHAAGSCSLDGSVLRLQRLVSLLDSKYYSNAAEMIILVKTGESDATTRTKMPPSRQSINQFHAFISWIPVEQLHAIDYATKQIKQ